VQRFSESFLFDVFSEDGFLIKMNNFFKKILLS
jgi:hypothetical protein